MDNISGVTVNLSSLALNTLNFLLFDLMLAAAVYYLTADLAGLANSMSAVQGKSERISFYSPGIVGVGVGITSTKRRVFYILAFFRLVSFSLIFVSSMSFVGKTIAVPRVTEANVTTLGKLLRQDDTITIGPRQLLRQGCQGRTNSTVYYGEIREIGGKKQCELNTTLIPPPIEIDFFYHPETLDLSACMRENVEEALYVCANGEEVSCISRTQSSTSMRDCVRVRKTPLTTCVSTDLEKNTTFSCGKDQELLQNCKRDYKINFLNFRCQNAIIGCQLNALHRPCKASVNLRDETYLCEGNGTQTEGVFSVLRNASLQDGPQDFNNLEFFCKKAKGAEWNVDSWLPHLRVHVVTLEQAYAAMYGSGSQKRMVKIVDHRPTTTISWVWIAILCFKIAIIAGLAGAVLVLRKGKGCQRVANDEVGLGYLLMSSKAQWSRFSPADEPRDSQGSKSVLLLEMEDNNVRLYTEDTEERAV